MLLDDLEKILEQALAGKNYGQRDKILSDLESFGSKIFSDFRKTIEALRRVEIPELEKINPSTAYAIPDVVDFLRKKNDLYNEEAVRSLARSGHLELFNGKILGSSILNHLYYMNGKCFSDEIGTLVTEIHQSTDIERIDIEKQIRRGAMEVMGSSDYPLEIIVMQDTQIIEMLHNGRWMNITEIKDHVDLPPINISKILKENQDTFKTHKQGRSWVGYITPQNSELVGLPPKIIESMIKSSILVTLTINNRDYRINQGKKYPSEEVKKYLSSINPIFHSDATIEKVIEQKGENGTICGSNLIDFINEVNGMILLTSAKEILENRLKIPYTEIVKFFEQAEINKFLHTMYGVFTGSFIKENELDGLIKGIKTQMDAGGGILKAMQECRSRLTQKHIMPNGTLYTKLLNLRILRETNPDDVRESYYAFEKAMDGFAFYNFDRVRLEMGIEWDEFIAGPMKTLIDKGLARNLVDYMGMKNSRGFYVVAKDRREEVYPTLGIKRS